MAIDPIHSQSKKLRHAINCAKAMDLWFKDKEYQDHYKRTFDTVFEGYNPYHNYAACLKIVERYHLSISRQKDKWLCSPSVSGQHFKDGQITILNKDIRVAIIECASELYEVLERRNKDREKARKFK